MRVKQCRRLIFVKSRSSHQQIFSLPSFVCINHMHTHRYPKRTFSGNPNPHDGRPSPHPSLKNPPQLAPQGSFLQDVDSICQALSMPKWGFEVEQALKALPFHITAHHVHEVLKRKHNTRVVLCFFLWVRLVHGFKHNNLTYNSVVHIAVGAQELRFLEQVFQYLQEDGCVLGTITCNVLIRGYGMAHRIEEAFAIFARMDGHAFCKPNIWTCNLLLHILVKENELDWVHEFYHRILNAGFRQNIVTCNIWMLYLCRCGKFDEGYKWLEEMPCLPNFVTYSTLIDGLCKAGKMVEANSLFDRMLDNDISPDVFVFSSLINGYCKAELLDEAWKFFKHMDAKGVKPNIVTYTTLIDGMLKAGKTDGALGLLEYMQARGCVPNVYLCTARIDSLCKQGHLDAARSLLKHMDEVGCAPNAVTYCALIDGHLKAGFIHEAMELVSEMSAKSCTPDTFLYSSLVYEFGKAGEDAKAKLILEESLVKQSAPDVWIMNCWMSGLCRSGRVDDAFHLFINLKAEGFASNTITYNILITGFCKSSRVGYARIMFEGIIESNCRPDLSTYTNLVKGYCKIGAVSHASKWLVESFEKGFVHIFRFHVYTILDIFELRRVYHAKSFLKLLGSHCTFSAEVDRKLFYKLLEAGDGDSANKAIARWKSLRGC